jgi:splicing factor 3A subunit 3
MMEILERQRNAHEDIERMEQAIVDRMAEEPRTRYDALATEHQVAEFLTDIQRQADYLVETYRDENGARAREIESMTGSTNEFDKFYQEYAELREIHRRHPNLQVEDLEKNYLKRSREEMEEDPITNMFTGEESWGRFLDLTSLHEVFVNLRDFPRYQYIEYVKEFQNFRKLPAKLKSNDYLEYLIVLQEYLEAFLKRVQPIVNHRKLMNKISTDFANAWENGSAPGQNDEENHAINGSSPLYCDVCQKQFAKETVYNAHLEGNKHKKNVERAKAEANGTKENEEPTPGKMTRGQRRKEISRHEYTITKLCQQDRLMTIIPATIGNVERRSVLSDRERQVESLLPA